MSAFWISIALASTAMQSSPQQAARPEAFARLVACRAVADANARLACFDREVAAVEAAAANNDLVVVDRDRARQVRRSLFGFTLPDLPFFGGDDEEEGQSEINSRIVGVWRAGRDKWGFTLEGGARWAQTDSRNLTIDPEKGDPIRIRRAAMGSFLANVGGQTAIRVKRVD